MLKHTYTKEMQKYCKHSEVGMRINREEFGMNGDVMGMKNGDERLKTNGDTFIY